MFNNFIVRYWHTILFFAIGIFVGYISTNWSLFEWDYKISFHETVSLFLAAGITVYVGNNIQRALSFRQSDYAVLKEEIKELIVSIKKLEGWISEKKLPFEEAKKYFKAETINWTFYTDLFITTKLCDKKDFKTATDLFFKIKKEILDISPVRNEIPLTNAESDRFLLIYTELRKELMKLILKHR